SVNISVAGTAECINGGSNHPKAVNKAAESASGTFNVSNGQATGSLTMTAANLNCSPPMTIAWTDLVVTDTTFSDSASIPGTFFPCLHRSRNLASGPPRAPSCSQQRRGLSVPRRPLSHCALAFLQPIARVLGETPPRSAATWECAGSAPAPAGSSQRGAFAPRCELLATGSLEVDSASRTLVSVLIGTAIVGAVAALCCCTPRLLRKLNNRHGARRRGFDPDCLHSEGAPGPK